MEEEFVWLFWVDTPGYKHPKHFECITEDGSTVVCNLLFSDNKSKTRVDAVHSVLDTVTLGAVGMSRSAACGASFRIIKFYGRCAKVIRTVPAHELELTL